MIFASSVLNMMFNFQLIYWEGAFVSSLGQKAEVNFCGQNLPLSHSIIHVGIVVVIPFLTYSPSQVILAQTIFG